MVEPLPRRNPPDPAESLWDIAVVGAGPAGSLCAYHVARRGFRTLLCDKESFPRDKACGDLLIPDAIAVLRRAGLYDLVRDQAWRLHTIRVYSPSRIAFDVPGDYLALKRISLDSLLAQKAAEAGARLLKAAVMEVRSEAAGTVALSVWGSAAPIRARIAVLATGAVTDLASKIGMVERRGNKAVFPFHPRAIGYNSLV